MKLGQVVVTRGANELMKSDVKFANFIFDCMGRYAIHDWGDLPESDKAMNDSAIKNNDDRILARYNHEWEPIYVITEWDRSATTILFTSEY